MQLTQDWLSLCSDERIFISASSGENEQGESGGGNFHAPHTNHTNHTIQFRPPQQHNSQKHYHGGRNHHGNAQPVYLGEMLTNYEADWLSACDLPLKPKTFSVPHVGIAVTGVVFGQNGQFDIGTYIYIHICICVSFSCALTPLSHTLTAPYSYIYNNNNNY